MEETRRWCLTRDVFELRRTDPGRSVAALGRRKVEKGDGSRLEVSLKLGKTYSYDDLLFVIVRERDEFSFDILCLTNFGWRHKAGEVKAPGSSLEPGRERVPV